MVAQELERGAVVDAVALHQDALGALDHRAALERALELVDLLLQPLGLARSGASRPRSRPARRPARRTRHSAAMPRSAARATKSTSSAACSAITGPEAYSTVSSISASACSSSWWTTTIERSGSSRADQLGRLGDRPANGVTSWPELLEQSPSASSASSSSSASRTRRFVRRHASSSAGPAQRPLRATIGAARPTIPAGPSPAPQTPGAPSDRRREGARDRGRSETS